MMVDPVASPDITPAELRLAARNHGTPLESLRYEVTPVGLHYLLIHYDIPEVDERSWQLRIGGRVRSPLSLSMADLRARPAMTVPVTLECAGNGRALLSPRPVSQPWLLEAVGTAAWTGTPLRGLLEDAGLDDAVSEVVFTGLDGGLEGGQRLRYERGLPIDEALGADVLVAYEMNGQPLPPQHGYPARLVVPGWYGMASVKWLAQITAVDEPFDGYQNTTSYRLRVQREEEGEPLGRIAVRALLVPPGVPDFATRRRFVDVGPVRLTGRCWSGHGDVERVEVSADGGRSWLDAAVDARTAPHAWQGWSVTWEADTPGDLELCCRATDSAGNTQPLDADWNLGGYANNAVQRVPVTVVDPAGH